MYIFTYVYIKILKSIFDLQEELACDKCFGARNTKKCPLSSSSCIVSFRSSILPRTSNIALSILTCRRDICAYVCTCE